MLSLLAFALLGCEDEEICARAARIEPTLEIGVGEEDFTALADGDRLDPERGSQGGSHVWVALRAAGIDPGVEGFLAPDKHPPTVSATLLGPDGAIHGDAYTDRDAFAGDETEAELTGLQLYLGFGGEPGTHTLVVTVEDACGTVLEAERTVILE